MNDTPLSDETEAAYEQAAKIADEFTDKRGNDPVTAARIAAAIRGLKHSATRDPQAGQIN